VPTPYDEVRYESRPVPGTAPERLARASLSHGGPLPRPRDFRTLELGCGDGANLLPLAFYRPDASFVGIDSAGTAIRAARAAADELALANVCFVQADLADDAAAAAGEFDYVIAHGVLSWVGERARSGLLRTVDSTLAPSGLCYLSHNVRAGWVVRGQVRDILRGATAGEDGLPSKARRARCVAAELLRVVARSDHAYQVLLAYELERIATADEGYVVHEYLCEENVAFDHPQVVALLAAHGMTYLCDARHDDDQGRVPTELRDVLERLGYAGDELEQAADVLGHRRFRASVFCRTDARGARAEVAQRSQDDADESAHPHGLPHRLAVFEATRRAWLTKPDHTALALRDEERELVLRLAAGQQPAGSSELVQRLAQHGLARGATRSPA